MKKVAFYEKQDTKIKCRLCPHNCLLKEGKTGICRVRRVTDGELYSLNYGQVSSLAIDPIEKKPLYHFYPGSDIISMGTWGCNFKCDFCQNWQISQKKPSVNSYHPQQIIDLAQKKDVVGIAYTYSEPLIWYEFVLECSRLAHKNNLKNVLVTNGYINQKPLKELLPFIDAANVDLKAFNNDFYKKYCGGRLEPVKENIKIMEKELHLELTTLIIPGLNDGEDEMEQLFYWIGKISPDIPLHLSRYFPNYQLKKEATPLKTMKRAYNLATDYLNYVYLGNTRSSMENSTKCPECSKELILRNIYSVENRLNQGKCSNCGYKIEGEF